MSQEKPLIWTSKGNLPVEDLQYSAHWEVTNEYIKFSEKWKLGDEVVKENAHVCVLQNEAQEILQHSFA